MVAEIEERSITIPNNGTTTIDYLFMTGKEPYESHGLFEYRPLRYFL